MRRPTHALTLLAAAAVLMGLLAPAAAADRPTSKQGADGPALQVPTAALRKSLQCTGNLRSAQRSPVLLVPDYSSSADSYGWNYGRQLPALGYPTCRLDLPGRGTADLQVTAEHVVHAVRQMRALSGRQVTVIGHAFAQLAVRWAVTFWPDVRATIRDSISIAAPEQGTALTQVCSLLRQCPPSAWQVRPGSKFLERLNQGPVPGGPAYTTISTRFDELIFPQPRASTLPGARNVVLQDLCPGRPVDHFSILGDAVAYRLVLDAITHRGPADPARLSQTACRELLMPGVTTDPQLPLLAVSGLVNFPLIILSDMEPAEPRLREYTR